MKHTVLNFSINIIVLVAIDILMAFFALQVSHFIRMYLENFSLFHGYDGNANRFTFSGLLYLFELLIFYVYGLYHKRNDFFEEMRIIWQSVVVLFVLLFFYTFVTKTTDDYSRPMVVMMFFLMLVFIPLGRLVGKILLHKVGSWPIRAYIEGSGEQYEKLKKDLHANRFLGYKVVNDIQRAKVVFIATKGMDLETLESLMLQYKRSMHEVIVIPYLNNISFSNADIIDLRIARTSMLNIQNQLFKPKNIAVKKVSELLVVMLIMPLFVLIYSLLALLIRVDSKGSILFRQERMGKDGKAFICYKFRTMYENSDAMLEEYLKENPAEIANYEKFHKYKNDPRITKIGRFLRFSSLDELPQMINVLKGEMSLIGPRPYLFSEKSKMGQRAEIILHVAPGITGFWQINGRNELSFEERMELDSWYIQNWSLWLDFIIFIKTFAVIITRRGAF